jgi:hypothetical protein
MLSGERDASKGIITTTSGFAPRIFSDPFTKPFLPTRLELMNGAKFKEWLTELLKKQLRCIGFERRQSPNLVGAPKDYTRREILPKAG